MVSFGGIARKIFGSSNERRVKGYQPRVQAINALEGDIQALSDEALKAKTGEFRQRLESGEELDALLPEAFAVVREASKRVLGMRPFDVQLIGGMVQHEGAISEMRTGEGKTLVATLPAYLNALGGKGVHVVTVNDYLAKRDAEWMGQIYNFLGMSVSTIVHGMDDEQRQAAYAADITYATNNELGFDYLRDNMKYERAQMVQRGHNFAIIDEVDSILIDEARTPLIISGPLDDRSELYVAIDKIIPHMQPDDFTVDEKQRTAVFTEEGTEKIEQLLAAAGHIAEGSNLYDIENVSIVHHVNNALKAHTLFQRDKDYIKKGDEIVIIDEFTGRQMPGRRFSEGLHQALEAKEGASIQPENQTLASVTFQNYFRMYEKLAGMTGTANTEAEEFANIYGLEVVEIPTNLPVKRVDEDDEVYRTVQEKYDAVILDIIASQLRGQPVLVGTTSIEKSELISTILKEPQQLKAMRDRVASRLAGIKEGKEPELRAYFEEAAHNLDTAIKQGGVKHDVLNARQHEREAHIVSQAGVPGTVTIATNMAGRGTDIKLGGNAEMRIEDETAGLEGEALKAKIAEINADIETLKQQALEAGGLYVLATERHESRRIDNQLRGRSGRQGDPGRSKFYLSLQDDLMRIFGSERMDGMLQKLGLREGEAIVHPWINKALEKAQKKVEARNFDIRKNLLKYDDVMNDQRKVIFEQRLDVMDGKGVSEMVTDMRHEVIDTMIADHIPEKSYPEQWDMEGMHKAVMTNLNMDVPVKDWAMEEGVAEDDILERLTEVSDKYANERAERFGPEITSYIEKSLILQTLDELWREHLVNLDHLRSAVGFRGYAQRDPLQEYKSEAFELFQSMLTNLRQLVTQKLMRVEIVREGEQDVPPAPQPVEMHEVHDDAGSIDHAGDAPAYGAALVGGAVAAEDRDPNDESTWGKVQRNEACPCGSGKKYKHCHGAYA